MGDIINFEEYIVTKNSYEFIKIVKNQNGIQTEGVTGKRKIRLSIQDEKVVVLLNPDYQPEELLQALDCITDYLKIRLNRIKGR